MRVLFISMVAVMSLVGCDSFPYMNLEEPICLVATESFFVGCDKDPAMEVECRESRLEVVRSGTAEWFDFFQEETRPSVLIVESEDELPSGLVNTLVYLRVDKDLCEAPNALACYHKDLCADPDIVFVTEERIRNIVLAHEFGHVLGLDHYDGLEGMPSIMSAGNKAQHVQSDDIDRVCEIHAECPARDLLWEGVE